MRKLTGCEKSLLLGGVVRELTDCEKSLLLLGGVVKELTGCETSLLLRGVLRKFTGCEKLFMLEGVGEEPCWLGEVAEFRRRGGKLTDCEKSAVSLMALPRGRLTSCLVVRPNGRLLACWSSLMVGYSLVHAACWQANV